MDSPRAPAVTFTAQPGAAAQATVLAPPPAAEAADDGAAAEAAPRPCSRKERLQRLLLASRQLQQR